MIVVLDATVIVDGIFWHRSTARRALTGLAQRRSKKIPLESTSSRQGNSYGRWAFDSKPSDPPSQAPADPPAGESSFPPQELDTSFPVLSSTFDSQPRLQEGPTMTIALAKDVEEFLQEQVRAGVCADASELANNVLRSLRDQQRIPLEITHELEAWLLEAADRPSANLTSADFDGIRERVRSRTQGKGTAA